MLRIFVGSHVSKIRAWSHEPLQRLTCTNWGEFLRVVTSGSTWTTSENNPHFISESWSFSERKYALVDVIKHNAGAKMIYNGRFYLGGAWRVGGGGVNRLTESKWQQRLFITLHAPFRAQCGKFHSLLPTALSFNVSCLSETQVPVSSQSSLIRRIGHVNEVEA